MTTLTHNIDDLVRELQSVNREVKRQRGSARRRLMAVKDRLLSAAIEQLGVGLSWHLGQSGQPLVLVSFGDRACFHAPFDALTVSARVNVINQIGPP